LEVLWVCPRFLTFVNVAAGGTSDGWQVVNNSDFDWGQGLIDLRNWMNQRNIPTVRFAYFGFVDPKAYGVESTPFTTRSDAQVIAISSYFLDGLQQRILIGNSQRQWIEFKTYRELRKRKPI